MFIIFNEESPGRTFGQNISCCSKSGADSRIERFDIVDKIRENTC